MGIKDNIQKLRTAAPDLAKKVVDRYNQLHPEFSALYKNGYQKSVQDAEFHLLYLAEALDCAEPALFFNYLSWTSSLFASMKIPLSVLEETLRLIGIVLEETLGLAAVEEAKNLIAEGIAKLGHLEMNSESYLIGDEPVDVLARDYLAALLKADRKKAGNLVAEGMEQGISIKDIYLKVFQRTQQEIGRLWQLNKITVAQEHFCTAATQMIMSQLYPFIFTGELKDKHIVVACIGGELHELGARMVADIFELEGWDSYFVGANTPQEALIATVQERHADMIALSVTMTYHLPALETTIGAMKARFPRMPILVGGYPFNITQGLWEKVGADAYAPDAVQAVQVAEGLLRHGK
jgi:methanogenic corrinoid protein MtbC1